MNEIMKPKIEYLRSTGNASTVLAVLAAASTVPGAMRLYQFMVDAQDQNIEVSNLLGVGDRSIPGLGVAIQEPYVTLTILILAVLIPLLVFLFLLAKNSGLKKGKVVGTGLYWLIILAGGIGTLLGLGLLGKILDNDFSNLTAINTDPESLFIAAVSLVSIIVAFVVINLLGKAAIAPNVLVDEDEEDEDLDIQVVERGTPAGATVLDDSEHPALVTEPVSAEPVSRTFAADPAAEKMTMDSLSGEISTEPVSEDFSTAPEDEGPLPFASDLSSNDEPAAMEALESSPTSGPEDYVSVTEGEAQMMEPAEVPADQFVPQDDQSAAAAIMERDLGMPAAASVAADQVVPAGFEKTPYQPDNLGQTDQTDYEELAEPASYTHQPSGPVLIPAKAAGQSAAETPPAAQKPKDREIKRKLVSFPGDDTKVIVILREYVHGRFVREWTEIRLKSDFTRHRNSSRS